MQEQFCDVGRGITLCYETFGDPADPPAVLVMGLAVQLVAWHEDFCRELAARGLYVVRFDNRDSGRSTHMRTRPPNVAQLALRLAAGTRRASAYTLSDMAQDTAGLIDCLGLAPAHVIGASMGGMIAQTLAAEHPAKVRSLVSMMSNTGNRFSGRPKLGLYRLFVRRPLPGREGFVADGERLFATIGSTGLPQDLDDIRAQAEQSYKRDHDPAGPTRQLAAIIASGDRTAKLRTITAPTLVIHGTADPLVTPSGGRATARAIPGASLMLVQGMGHDLPRAAWPTLIDAISEHTARADRGARSTPHPRARAASRSGPTV